VFLSACLLVVLPAADSRSTITSVAASADGKLLFVASAAGRAPAGSGWVHVWDLSKPELRAEIPDLGADGRAVQPSADGKRFVLIGGDNWRVSRVEVWDTAAKKRLRVFEVPPGIVGQAVASPDGNWVAYRAFREGKETVRVWNAENGEPAAVATAVAGVPGPLAFTPDSKRLIVAAPGAYTEFDLATGKTAAEWKREVPADRVFVEDRHGAWLAAAPGGKGVVSVAATAKRRQSYVIRLVTEKKDWFLGEMWDYASHPAVSPDGRWLALSGGGYKEHGTFLLRLDADGNPELEDKPEKFRQPFGGGDGKKVPAWRDWAVGEADRAGHELPGAIGFSADGRRVFVAASRERIQVWDPEKRELKATLSAATTAPAKDKLPDWLIHTPAGEFVGSPAGEKAFARPGTDPNPAKVKEALTGK